MHEHNECEHEFKYCRKCDAVYCEKCRTEWKKQAVWVTSSPKSPLDPPYAITIGNSESKVKYEYVDAVGRTTVPYDGQLSGYVEVVYHDHFNMGNGE